MAGCWQAPGLFPATKGQLTGEVCFLNRFSSDFQRSNSAAPHYWRRVTLKNVSIPQYKISQYILRSINGFKISLLHILHTDDLERNDNNVVANHHRLDDIQRMIIALRDGDPVLDVAKVSNQTLDVFTVGVTYWPGGKDPPDYGINQH